MSLSSAYEFRLKAKSLSQPELLDIQRKILHELSEVRNKERELSKQAEIIEDVLASRIKKDPKIAGDEIRAVGDRWYDWHEKKKHEYPGEDWLKGAKHDKTNFYCLAKLLDRGDWKAAARHAEMMDTILRDEIPDHIWAKMHELAEEE